MQKIEEIILKSFFENEEYAKKVVPHFKVEYFDDHNSRMVVKKVLDYVAEYKTIPNYETTFLNIQNDKKLPSPDEIIKTLTDIKAQTPEKYDMEFLMKETEKHFQEVALSKAVIESAEILGTQDASEKSKKKSLIPEKIRNALKISFNNKVGREYLTQEEIDNQYFYYHHQERKFPFPRWKYLTEVTRGGMAKKKLNVFISASGVGKTSWLTNVAEQYIATGIDVLYVTLEIAEEEIIERIDGNLLDTKTCELQYISKNDYSKKLVDLKAKGYGRLFVKEYPPAAITTNTIRFLLEDLKMKHSFQPTAIIVDYINLMLSCRVKQSNDSYSYVKNIVEELRGLAVEKEIVLWTATQFNRSGYNNTDVGMENTSESMGTVMTADWIAALIETDELKANSKQMIKQLKSRYAPIYPSNERWLVYMDKDKQRIEEIEGEGGKLPDMNIDPRDALNKARDSGDFPIQGLKF